MRLHSALKKAEKSLRDLAKKLEARRTGQVKGGKLPTEETVRKQVVEILKDPEVRTVIHAEVNIQDNLPKLHFEIDQKAINTMAEERFGKLILFSDNDTWSNEEIIAAYHGQFHIEDAFRQMKDPHFVSWRPMFHWTDPMIRVHAFYCVIALSLTSLLWREVCHRFAAEELQHEAPGSIQDLLEKLEGITEVAHIYPPEFKVKDHFTLSEMDTWQRRLYEMLNLKELAP